MKLNLAICDDEQSQCEYLKFAVNLWAKENGHICDTKVFPSAEAFYFEYSENAAFDILLLDIEMGEMNGVELAKKIRSGNDRVQIVFITGFPDFISEGYEVSALHYLMKPVSGEKLGSVLDRAAANLAKSEKQLTVTFDRHTDYIPFSKIIYIEAQKQYIEIVTESETYRTKTSLSDTGKELDEYFLKCHRSYIVDLRYVSRILSDHILLKNGVEIPISRGMAEKIGKEIIRLF